MTKTYEVNGWSECVRQLADVLGEDNTLFNRSAFYAACGLVDRAAWPMLVKSETE